MKELSTKVRCGRWLGWICLLVFFSGCGVNLVAIREFADASSKTAQYTGLVKQYVNSPIRQKKYQPKSQHSALEEMAKKRKEQKKALVCRHTMIEEYMDALGQLAADEIVTYDKQVNKLGKALKEAKFVDKKEETAISAVTKLLIKAVSDGWRTKKLKSFIRDANEPLQVVIDSLSQIIKRGFVIDLEIEKAAIHKYYRSIIADSKDPAGIAALEEWMQIRLDELAKRKSAIGAYNRSLEKISKGHQKLYDNLGKLDKDSLLGLLSRYAKNLEATYEAIRDR